MNPSLTVTKTAIGPSSYSHAMLRGPPTPNTTTMSTTENNGTTQINITVIENNTYVMNNNGNSNH